MLMLILQRAIIESILNIHSWKYTKYRIRELSLTKSKYKYILLRGGPWGGQPGICHRAPPLALPLLSKLPLKPVQGQKYSLVSFLHSVEAVSCVPPQWAVSPHSELWCSGGGRGRGARGREGPRQKETSGKARERAWLKACADPRFSSNNRHTERGGTEDLHLWTRTHLVTHFCSDTFGNNAAVRVFHESSPKIWTQFPGSFPCRKHQTLLFCSSWAQVKVFRRKTTKELKKKQQKSQRSVQNLKLSTKIIPFWEMRHLS